MHFAGGYGLKLGQAKSKQPVCPQALSTQTVCISQVAVAMAGLNLPVFPQVSADVNFAAGDDVTNSRMHFTIPAVPVCISQAAASYVIGQP